MSETFSPVELEDPLRAAKRLVLASQDMGDAADAASALIERPGSRILETALAVSYARPWTPASIVALESHWAPTDDADLRLHEELLRLRSKLYAHTDEELGARGIRDVSSYVGAPSLVLAAEWRFLKPELLPAFERLAKDQRTRFREAANELALLVRRFAVEVRWSPEIASPARNVPLDELESEIFALRPTSAAAAGAGLAVEIDLIDPTPDRDDFDYGVRRLLRTLRQWDRRLLPDVQTRIGIPPNTYIVPLGGGSDPGKLNHEVLLAEYRRHLDEPGDRHWAAGWHRSTTTT